MTDGPSAPPLPLRPPVGTVYPALPVDSTEPDSWRLAEISRVREHFSREAQNRGQTRRKYKRAIAVITAVSTVGGSLAAGCSVASLITASTGVGAVAALPLGGVALGLVIVSVGCVGTLKWLSRKEAKHGKIESLALCRINDVKALTSQALTDGRISAEEFRLVLREEESYRQVVDGIRAEDRSASQKAPVDIEALKNEMLAQGRKDALREISVLAAAGGKGIQKGR